MPKLKNVADADLCVLTISASDIGGDDDDFASLVEQGYSDKFETPLLQAGTLLAASRALARAAHALLMRAQLDEQKRELETAMRKRVA